MMTEHTVGLSDIFHNDSLPFTLCKFVTLIFLHCSKSIKIVIFSPRRQESWTDQTEGTAASTEDTPHYSHCQGGGKVLRFISIENNSLHVRALRFVIETNGICWLHHKTEHWRNVGTTRSDHWSCLPLK